MRYIIFSYEGLSLPLAYKLQESGEDVTVGIVQHFKELELEDTEEIPEMMGRRLVLYDGLIEKKFDAKSVIKWMETIENKDDYFVFFDFNNLWKYSEEVLKMGFKNGLFPLKEDYEMEHDRKLAKDFVKKHYKDIKVADEQSFDNVDEGIEFLNETENTYVLKGNNDEAKTIVPKTDDPEQAKELIISALENNQEVYEREGFILEQKIVNALELTPEIVFWNGKPVYTSVDIETKYKEPGDKSIQVGCGTSLVVKTELEDKINQIAFPEIVYKMAKERNGLFVWDASLLIDSKNGEIYFGEFCPNRPGYDSLIAEIAMSGDENETELVKNYFDKVSKGENPLINKFSTTVRLFNEHHDNTGKIKGGDLVSWDDKAEPDAYFYEILKVDGDIISGSYYPDLGVITGFSNESPEEAAERMYMYVDMVNYDGLSYRWKEDFLSYSYPSAILNRYDYFINNF